jgi:DNA-binding phage protein
VGAHLFESPLEEDGMTEQQKLDRVGAILADLEPERRTLLWKELMGKRKTTGPPTLTDQLKQAIAASGRTHSDIGKQAGVSPGVILRFMADQRSPTLKTVDRIAAALGLRLTGPTE